MSDRLGLFVTNTGERWVTSVPDTGHPLKTIMRGGRQYTLLMTMAVEHVDFAETWAGGYASSVYTARTTR